MDEEKGGEEKMNLLEKKVRILESIIKLVFAESLHPDARIVWHSLPETEEFWYIEITDINFHEDLLTVLRRLRQKFHVDITSEYQLLGKRGKINGAWTNLELCFDEAGLLGEAEKKR